MVMQMDAIANEECDIQHEARNGFQVRTHLKHTHLIYLLFQKGHTTMRAESSMSRWGIGRL